MRWFVNNLLRTLSCVTVVHATLKMLLFLLIKRLVTPFNVEYTWFLRNMLLVVHKYVYRIGFNGTYKVPKYVKVICAVRVLSRKIMFGCLRFVGKTMRLPELVSGRRVFAAVGYSGPLSLPRGIW